MSFFYNVFYSGVNLIDWEEAFINECSTLLKSFRSDARILDCSCGFLITIINFFLPFTIFLFPRTIKNNRLIILAIIINPE